MKVYFIQNIDQLQAAQAIINENKLCNQQNLCQTKLYSWTKEDDHQINEGILDYPPEDFSIRKSITFRSHQSSVVCICS